MAHVLLLHSALGLRPGVHAYADRLRAHGHTVEVPDYYEGRVFDDATAGVAHRDEVGVRALMDRVRPHVEALPEDAVLAGFSLGAFLAQTFAARRPASRGAVLLHSCTSPRGGWNGVPVQVHRYETDPWIEPAEVTALEQAVRASGASFEDLVVPGEGHLFTDLDDADGDPAALELSLDRVLTLLA